MPLLLLLACWRGQLPCRWLPLAWVTVVFSLRPWTQPAGLHRARWLAPFAALLIQMAGSYGLLRHWSGRGVAWKGRRV